MYENVSHGFYITELRRTEILEQEAFDRLKIMNIAHFESLKRAYYITEYGKNGIDSAICMMCEVDYLANKAMVGEEHSGRVSSTSVGSVSESYDKSYATAVIAANVKAVEVQKMDWIKLFCHVYCGVK